MGQDMFLVIWQLDTHKVGKKPVNMTIAQIGGQYWF